MPIKAAKLHPDFEWAGDEPSGRVLPKRRTPVLARPGMAVYLTVDDDDFGMIVAVLEDYAVIRTCTGEVIAKPWADVDLTDVAPDPAHVLRSEPKRASKRGGRKAVTRGKQ